MKKFLSVLLGIFFSVVVATFFVSGHAVEAASSKANRPPDFWLMAVYIFLAVVILCNLKHKGRPLYEKFGLNRDAPKPFVGGKTTAGSKNPRKRTEYQVLSHFHYLCFSKKTRELIQLTIADMRRDKKEMQDLKMSPRFISFTLRWQTIRLIVAITLDAIIEMIGKVLPLTRVYNFIFRPPQN